MAKSDRTRRQEEIIDTWKEKGTSGTVQAATGFGKAQPFSEPVLTPSGWKNMGTIDKGNFVIGSDGKPKKVLGVYYQGEKDIYQVEFSDDSVVRCTADHLWAVRTKYDKHRDIPFRVRNTRDLMGEKFQDGLKDWFIPKVSPVEFPERDLPVHPYLMGILLSEGYLKGTSVTIHSDDEFVIQKCESVLNEDHTLVETKDYGYRIRGKYQVNKILDYIRDFNLAGKTSDEKFIPEEYLYSSIKQRKDLLRGLMDGDGWCRPENNHCAISFVSEDLIRDTCELVRSFGGVTKVQDRGEVSYKGSDSSTRYKVVVNISGLNPFSLPRKRENYNIDSDQGQAKKITDIRKDGREEAMCLKVDADDSLYVTSGYTLTHNTRIALKILESANKSLDTEVIVPTLYLQDQWEERLRGWGLDSQVDVMVINSAVKESRSVDFLILDEIHRYGSEVFGRIFKERTYDHILGLTATLPEGDEKYKYIRDFADVIAMVTLSECLEKEWVSPFIVYNLPVELSFAERRKYNDLNDKYSYHFSRFGHNFDIAMKCLKNNQFARQYANQRNWSYNKVKKHAVQWIRNTNKRKEMLYNLTSKLKVGKRLIKRFSDKKIISFSQTQQFAERLCDYAKGHAVPYHSDMSKGSKEDAMKMFERGDRHVLSTAKAMDQGADLPDLSMALVLAATSKPLQSIQRMGRVLRKQEGKRAIIVEVYAKDTQDEKWLQKRQRKTPRKAIHHVNEISDIIMEPTLS